MNFQDHINYAKLGREEAQQGPLPFLPPGMLVERAGKNVASVLSPKSDEQHLAGMLAMVPVCAADEVVVSLEGYVRPVDSESTGPISEDPWASPAILLVHVERGGASATSINPYSINDNGTIAWAAPGAVESPVLPKLIEAIRELFSMEVETKELKTELLNYLALNGYGVRITKAIFE